MKKRRNSREIRKKGRRETPTEGKTTTERRKKGRKEETIDE